MSPEPMANRTPTLLTQEKLRDLFKVMTGTRASTVTVRHCMSRGMPYLVIGKRKLFNRDSVIAWLQGRENQSDTYTDH